MDQLDYFHEDVREQSVVSLGSMLRVTFQASEGDVSSEAMQTVLGEVIPSYLEVIGSDSEMGIVACALEGIKKAYVEIGIESVFPHMDKILMLLHHMCKGELICQTMGQDEDEDDEEGGECYVEDDDDTVGLMDIVTDVLGGLPKLCGGALVVPIQPCVEALLDMTVPTKSSDTRAMGIGCLADVIDGFGAEHAEPYVHLDVCIG